MNITNKEELIAAVEAILRYLKPRPEYGVSTIEDSLDSKIDVAINAVENAKGVEETSEELDSKLDVAINAIKNVIGAAEEILKSEEIEQPAEKPVVGILSADIKALLDSDDWPEAAPSFLICKENEDDKIERAEGIIDIINHDISNKKILDFGCGQGHLVKKMASQYLTSKVYGYDLKKDGILEWENEQGGLLTTNWEKIRQVGKFDIIILYDVLDHCENPVAELKKIRELCTTETFIFCRCHPWTSPHALHAYQKINKAYIQLFLTEAELKELGVEPTFNQKTFFPIKENTDWFEESNFYVENHKMAQIPVSKFFRNNPLIKERYPSCYKEQYPEWQMSQAFNDYVLKIK